MQVQVTSSPQSPVNIEFPGPLLALASADDLVTTPGTPQNVISGQQPLVGSWRLRRIEVVCRANTAFALVVDGEVVKRGYTSQAEATVSLPVEPWVKVAVGQEVGVSLSQSSGGPAVDVNVRVFYTSHDEA